MPRRDRPTVRMQESQNGVDVGWLTWGFQLLHARGGLRIIAAADEFREQRLGAAFPVLLGQVLEGRPARSLP